MGKQSEDMQWFLKRIPFCCLLSSHIPKFGSSFLSNHAYNTSLVIMAASVRPEPLYLISLLPCAGYNSGCG